MYVHYMYVWHSCTVCMYMYVRVLRQNYLSMGTPAMYVHLYVCSTRVPVPVRYTVHVPVTYYGKKWNIYIRSTVLYNWFSGHTAYCTVLLSVYTVCATGTRVLRYQWYCAISNFELGRRVLSPFPTSDPTHKISWKKVKAPADSSNPLSPCTWRQPEGRALAAFTNLCCYR